MAKLDRLLTLVKALSESAEGLTLDEMAHEIGADRRTAERLRDLILVHFDLEETIEDRRKRFRTSAALRPAVGLVLVMAYMLLTILGPFWTG
ncbi:hypothetical protein [Altericroceibacterium indicum]|uniref:hypothetical protein n=1 Tax=Altericroceibacterium indicum TaxID=374177 RepID=UPI001FEB0484|nr:hypothetical protein [Altericroceibacterium indicum]